MLNITLHDELAKVKRAINDVVFRMDQMELAQDTKGLLYSAYKKEYELQLLLKKEIEDQIKDLGKINEK